MPIKLKNNAFSTLASSITASDVGLTVASGEGSLFPTLSTGDYFYLTISSVNGTFEVVKVTARSGDSMTIVRAQEGSVANSFLAGSLVELRITSLSVIDSVSSYGIFVNVKSYGATGDGVTDDTTAINAAITAAGTNGTIFFPKGTYLVTSTLQMLTGQCFLGEGGQRASTIKKGANGDLINMVTRCRLEDLNLDCVGATYTGRGIYISAGVSQCITDVRVTNNVTYGLEFQATSGSGTKVSNFEVDMITASADTAGIKTGESYPQNIIKFFTNIWLSNAKFDLANAVGVSIENFFCRGFLTGPTFDACVVNKISNGRISNPGTQTFTMADSAIVNVPISGTTSLTGCQSLMLANCQFDTLTINNSTHVPASGGVSACFITHRPQTYTPTWTQSTGTGPALGDGTLTSIVTYNGFTVEYYLRLVMGSTTTYGDGTGAWQFSLPRISSPTANQYLLGAYIKQNSGNYIYVGEISIGAAETVLTIGYQNAAVRGVWPYAWAAGDVLEFNISYLAP